MGKLLSVPSDLLTPGGSWGLEGKQESWFCDAKGGGGASGVFQSSLGSLSPKISKLKHLSHQDIQFFFLSHPSSLHVAHENGLYFSFFKLEDNCFIGASLVAQTVKNLPAMQRPRFDPWVWKIPWRREWLPTPVFFPGKFQGQRSLVGYSPQSCKELDTTEQQLTLFSAL